MQPACPKAPPSDLSRMKEGLYSFQWFLPVELILNVCAECLTSKFLNLFISFWETILVNWPRFVLSTFRVLHEVWVATNIPSLLQSIPIDLSRMKEGLYSFQWFLPVELILNVCAECLTSKFSNLFISFWETILVNWPRFVLSTFRVLHEVWVATYIPSLLQSIPIFIKKILLRVVLIHS